MLFNRKSYDHELSHESITYDVVILLTLFTESMKVMHEVNMYSPFPLFVCLFV